MKKYIAVFLVLALCFCGCSVKEVLLPPEEEIVLPAIPIPVPAQKLPALPEDGGDQGTESKQTAEKYPWDTEFDPTGYTVWKENFDEGRAITWAKGHKNGRSLVYYNNGSIEDSYFYPSGARSHFCIYNADGSYSEIRWMDNGDVVIMPDGTKLSGLGTVFYVKNINTDGSWEETQYNSEESAEYRFCQFADGTYQEYQYYENGNFRKIITGDPAAGTYQEETYDEEEFLTYFHMKIADREIEMFTDENGKLVKVIENGQIIEDSAALAQYVTSYNFRN